MLLSRYSSAKHFFPLLNFFASSPLRLGWAHLPNPSNLFRKGRRWGLGKGKYPQRGLLTFFLTLG